jgi:WD40 repeat protein
MVEEYEEDGSIESFEGDGKPGKKFKEVKPYVNRLKRHTDAILVLHTLNGEHGNMMVSGSADEKIRIWDLKKKNISSAISVERPVDNVLIRYQAIGEDNLPLFPDG